MKSSPSRNRWSASGLTYKGRAGIGCRVGVSSIAALLKPKEFEDGENIINHKVAIVRKDATPVLIVIPVK